MMIVGLTGGIGSGKSTVAELFAGMGVPIIDTDIIARDLVEIDKPAYLDIVKKFGNDILLPNRTLNRAVLKQRILNNEQERLILEDILHPLIQQAVIKQIELVTGSYCIVVIPLLVEKAHYPMLDRILVVDTPVSQQIKRIADRDGLENASIEKLIAIQATREQRLNAADDVIINDHGLPELKAATQQMHDKYMKL